MVEPSQNTALVLFTKALLQVHPELEQGLPEGHELNSTCLQVFEKWAGSLQGDQPGDAVCMAPDIYEMYNTRPGQTQGSNISVVLSLNPSSTIFLKEFVNSAVDFDLATMTVQILNRLAYSCIEVWTPESMRELYSYTHWYGSDTDEEYLEEFEDMNGEPYNPEEHEALLPSAWYDTMAQAGYVPVGAERVSLGDVVKRYKGLSPKQDELVDALVELDAVIELPSIHCSQEDHMEKTCAAATFLWDENDFLPHLMDEVLEHRWNGGESSEEQTVLVYSDTAKVSEMENDIRLIERQMLVRGTLARVCAAIQSFCPPAPMAPA